MADIITEAELASYLQVTIPTGSAATLVARVNAKITDRLPDDFDWDPIPGDLKDLALEVAARQRRNPEGLTSKTTSIDDWSQTKRWEGGAAAQPSGIRFTAEEKAELALWAGLSPRRDSIQVRVPGYEQ